MKTKKFATKKVVRTKKKVKIILRMKKCERERKNDQLHIVTFYK